MKRPTTTAGFSLLEMTVAIGLLALVMGVAFSAIISASDSLELSSVRSDLTERVNQARNLIVRQLQATSIAAEGNVEVSADGTIIDFSTLSGLNAGDPTIVTWSDLQGIAFLIESAEGTGGTTVTVSGKTYLVNGTGDGNDNDNDGLVDEGVLAHARDVNDNSTIRILCDNVVQFTGGPDYFQLTPGGGTIPAATTFGCQVSFRVAKRLRSGGEAGATITTADTDIEAIGKGFVVIPFQVNITFRNR